MVWDPELWTEQAIEAMQQSHGADPRLYPWGLFSWDDAPPACGGGAGCFQWFPSLKELLAWVTDLSPASFMTFDDENEWLATRDALRPTGDQYSANPDTCLKELNCTLKGLLQIDWIGLWPDLLASTDPYPQLIRQRFRDDWDGDQRLSSAPIRIEELEEFCRFIQEYGV